MGKNFLTNQDLRENLNHFNSNSKFYIVVGGMEGREKRYVTNTYVGDIAEDCVGLVFSYGENWEDGLSRDVFIKLLKEGYSDMPVSYVIEQGDDSITLFVSGILKDKHGNGKLSLVVVD